MQFCVEEALIAVADVKEIKEQQEQGRRDAVAAAQREVSEHMAKLQGRA